MRMRRLKAGDPWTILRKTINEIMDALDNVYEWRVGPGLGITTRGNPYALRQPPEGIYPDLYIGGELLTLNSSNPTVTWTKDSNRRPVRYDGAYVKWDAALHKFIMVKREVRYDRGGNLIYIGVEAETDIIAAEPCVP